jgi:SAM-dependent methyltransferase
MMDRVIDHPYCSGRFGGSETEPLRPGGLELTRLVTLYAGFQPGDLVLDLGCGQGAGTRLLRRWGCEVVGLDVSTASLAEAAARMPGTLLVAAGARRLPFADASLDGILAECALSLVGGRDDALAECHRVLRPGGRLAITDVYAREPGVPETPLPTCLGSLATHAQIDAELRTAGFRVERWEDHSGVLKIFMARLIFASESPDALWAGDSAAMNAALRQQRPGYYLSIATNAGST